MPEVLGTVISWMSSSNVLGSATEYAGELGAVSIGIAALWPAKMPVKTTS